MKMDAMQNWENEDRPKTYIPLTWIFVLVWKGLKCLANLRRGS
jgi:hypothetical protein